MSSVPSFRKKGKVSVWVTVRKPDMKGMDILTDETGAIVADANVKVTYPAKQLERQVTTNSDGHFILPHLPPSRYKWTTLTFEVR